MAERNEQESGAHSDSSDTDYRRSVRQVYRDLHQMIEDNHTLLINPSNTKLPDLMAQLNDEIGKIVHPRECAMDAATIRRISELAVEQAEQIRIDAFDPEKYIERIYTLIGGRRRNESPLDWSGLGNKVMHVFNSTPSVKFIYGSLDIAPKRIVQRSGKSKRPSAADTVTPKEVREVGGGEEVTTKDVQHLLKMVKSAVKTTSNQRVHYFKFLIHPTSFAQSIENIFHFSFLVKDGRAGVEIYDGQPFIVFPQNIDEQSKQSTRKTRKQSIVSLNLQTWEELKALYKIKKPAFEPRVPIGQY